MLPTHFDISKYLNSAHTIELLYFFQKKAWRRQRLKFVESVLGWVPIERRKVIDYSFSSISICLAICTEIIRDTIMRDTLVPT